MAGTKRILALGLCLMAVLMTACGKDATNDKPSNAQSNNKKSPPAEKEDNKTTQTKQANVKEKAEDATTKEKDAEVKDVVIYLKNNSEAEIMGETISDLKELPKKLSSILFTGNQREGLSIAIGVDADQKTTYGKLKNTLLSLHRFGFQNLQFRCGEANVKIPVASASSSKMPNFYVLTINGSQQGEFHGMKIERDGKPSWLESGDINHGIKYAKKLFKEFTEQVKSKGDGTTQEIEIEIKTPDHVSAKTFLMICGDLYALTQSNDKSSGLLIRLWPTGYPTEQPLSFGALDEPLQTEIETELDNLKPQIELKEAAKEFDLNK